MAKKAALSDIVDRLKAEGSLTRNGHNSIKSVKELLGEQTDMLSNDLRNLTAVIVGNVLENKELQMEQDRYNERILAALEGMAKKQKEEEEVEPPQISLGTWAVGLTAALGGILGAVKGQWAAWKAFGKLFTTESLAKSFRGFVAGLSMRFDLLKVWAGEKFATARLAITEIFTKFKSLFSFGDDSIIANIFKTISSKLSGFTDIFKSVSSTIGGMLSGPLKTIKGWFGLIKAYMSIFGNTVSKIAGVVGKIFAPIAIVMTAYDTIVGAVEGYEKDGILGGIKGAIDGLFTSLITKPLDLLKDGVAWVLGKLGFDETSESLSSFSFTTLFTDMTGKIFGWIKGAWNFAIGLLGFSEEGSGATLRTNISTSITNALTAVKDWVVESFNEIIKTIKEFDLMTAVGNLSNLGETFIKNLLMAVLPAPDSLQFDAPSVSILGKTFGGGTINLNPIPDDLYEWLNQPTPTPTNATELDPGTPTELPPQQPETQLPELEASQAENAQLEAEQRAAAMGGGASNTVVDASTSSVNQIQTGATLVGSSMDPYKPDRQLDDTGGWAGYDGRYGWGG